MIREAWQLAFRQWVADSLSLGEAVIFTNPNPNAPRPDRPYATIGFLSDTARHRFEERTTDIDAGGGKVEHRTLSRRLATVSVSIYADDAAARARSLEIAITEPASVEFFDANDITVLHAIAALSFENALRQTGSEGFAVVDFELAHNAIKASAVDAIETMQLTSSQGSLAGYDQTFTE